MTFPYYDLNAPLEIRKPILTQIIIDLQDHYYLAVNDLCQYIIPTTLVPDHLQIDLLIHGLDLYQNNLSDQELLQLIQPTLDLYKDLVTTIQNGNAKATNSLVGKVLKHHSDLNPTQLKQVLTSLQG